MMYLKVMIFFIGQTKLCLYFSKSIYFYFTNHGFQGFKLMLSLTRGEKVRCKNCGKSEKKNKVKLLI